MKHVKTLTLQAAPRRASIISWFFPPCAGEKKGAFAEYSNDLWFTDGSLDYTDVIN